MTPIAVLACNGLPTEVSHWRKLGRVFAPDGSRWWARSHAMVPTPLLLDDGAIRVFFACVDDQIVSRVAYVDLDPTNPTRVVDMTYEPVLGVGEPGEFDEHGVNATCTLSYQGRLLLYYFGYQRLQSLPYTLFAGIAIGENGGGCFRRHAHVPLLERIDGERFVRSAPFVLPIAGGYRMWYVSGDRFITVGGKAVPTYCIRTLTSDDALRWPGAGEIAIEPVNDGDEYGLGRPYVLRRSDGFVMWYSRRSAEWGYRLGYAESGDGVSWQRLDHAVDIQVSSRGWDAEMICYPSVVETSAGTYLFYNGNGYGRTGFGVALLEP